jgi:predicted transcriptional regulator of viral defense system
MMQKRVTRLGPREAEFLTLLSSKSSMFDFEQAVGFWGSREMAGKKLSLLEKRGWLARLQKGKYLIIPLEAGIDRNWSEESYLIAASLAKPASIAYWSAMRHWNWTEQIPRIVYVQTTRRKKNARSTILGVEYEFVTVNARKFFGNIQEWRQGQPVLITGPEKTLLDCADDVERAGGIEELEKAVRHGAPGASWSTLHEHVHRFPNRAAVKRLGFLVETLVPNLPAEARQFLAQWQSMLSAGIAHLDPGGRKLGRINSRWRVKVNAEVG